ncbi:MAG: 2OG-Fe(II) oxygenase [Alphaproteobacteria bacterium]|nr:2OG-Fe(II) oxygenase [Alphaproteobacteria bacterium]
MLIDLDLLRESPLSGDPFDHIVVPGFIRQTALEDLHRDYPDVGRPGSFPVDTVTFGPSFGQILKEIQSPAMSAAIEEKLGVELAGKPTMVTVRDRCRARDGQIHVDSKGKVVTVLIYMNPPWEETGGRLRLLRGPRDIEDYAAEIPPNEGTLLAFRCTPVAWHGHKSFEGRRRAIQLNWVAGESYQKREQRRHRISAFFKRIKGG